MKEVLKSYFGHDEFRPLQEEIIKNVLEKKDVFVLMPTGGGKSLCYQVPALKLDGLTLVVSPLIALMKDQVDGLKANGVRAEFINSSLGVDEVADIQARVLSGEIKLLYVAPERLSVGSFRNFLSCVNVSLIAIDEAHCISEWGHDFRPDYRNLKSLRNVFPHVPVIALTATATPKVQKDICEELSLREPKIFVASFDRANLNFYVTEKKKAFGKLLDLVRKYKGESVIVYCFSRKDVEKISTNLRTLGFNALPYHAGLDFVTRRKNQELFIKDKVNIIVATLAFGMGVDKPDVRLVVHYTFPKTLEGYYQEIGRAGRDGLKSDCVLFYSRGDKFKHEFFVKQAGDFDAQNRIRTKLTQVMNFAESGTCRRKFLLNYFGEEVEKDKCGACDICLGGLKFECAKRNSVLDYNRVLFERLKVLRKKMSEERKVPPFVIFGDASLQEMCYYFPLDKLNFLRIKGVGNQKLDDFGEIFLNIIRAFVSQNGIVARRVPYMEKKLLGDSSGGMINEKTLEGIKRKLSVEDMAKMQCVKERTIVSHIERISDNGVEIDIDYLFLDKDKFEMIKEAFRKFGLERLRPVYDALGEKVSWDELRLVRVGMKQGSSGVGSR